MIITHDMQLVAEHVPRCAVMHGGRVIADADTAAVLGDRALVERAHLDTPQVTRLAHRMRDTGMPSGVFSVGAFCDQFSRLRAGGSGSSALDGR